MHRDQNHFCTMLQTCLFFTVRLDLWSLACFWSQPQVYITQLQSVQKSLWLNNVLYLFFNVYLMLLLFAVFACTLYKEGCAEARFLFFNLFLTVRSILCSLKLFSTTEINITSPHNQQITKEYDLSDLWQVLTMRYMSAEIAALWGRQSMCILFYSKASILVFSRYNYHKMSQPLDMHYLAKIPCHRG